MQKQNQIPTANFGHHLGNVSDAEYSLLAKTFTQGLYQLNLTKTVGVVHNHTNRMFGAQAAQSGIAPSPKGSHQRGTKRAFKYSLLGSLGSLFVKNKSNSADRGDRGNGTGGGDARMNSAAPGGVGSVMYNQMPVIVWSTMASRVSAFLPPLMLALLDQAPVMDNKAWKEAQNFIKKQFIKFPLALQMKSNA